MARPQPPTTCGLGVGTRTPRSFVTWVILCRAMVRRVLILVPLAALVLAASANASPGAAHKPKPNSHKVKPLSYKRARSAFQASADSLAATATTVTAFRRLSSNKFVGSAAWQQVNEHGCRACAYDEERGIFVDTPTIDDWWTKIFVIQRSTGKLYLKIDSFGTT